MWFRIIVLNLFIAFFFLGSCSGFLSQPSLLHRGQSFLGSPPSGCLPRCIPSGGTGIRRDEGNNGMALALFPPDFWEDEETLWAKNKGSLVAVGLACVVGVVMGISLVLYYTAEAHSKGTAPKQDNLGEDTPKTTNEVGAPPTELDEAIEKDPVKLDDAIEEGVAELNKAIEKGAAEFVAELVAKLVPKLDKAIEKGVAKLVAEVDQAIEKGVAELNKATKKCVAELDKAIEKFPIELDEATEKFPIELDKATEIDLTGLGDDQLGFHKKASNFNGHFDQSYKKKMTGTDIMKKDLPEILHCDSWKQQPQVEDDSSARIALKTKLKALLSARNGHTIPTEVAETKKNVVEYPRNQLNGVESQPTQFKQHFFSHIPGEQSLEDACAETKANKFTHWDAKHQKTQPQTLHTSELHRP